MRFFLIGALTIPLMAQKVNPHNQIQQVGATDGQPLVWANSIGGYTPKILPPAGGGTGAGAFTAGSVVFAGASGVYSQDNSNLYWDATNHRLGIGTTSPAGPLDIHGASMGLASVGATSATVFINNLAGGQQTAFSFLDAGTEKFRVGKQTDNSVFFYDDASSRDFIREISGVLQLQPVAGSVSMPGLAGGGTQIVCVLNSGVIVAGGCGSSFTPYTQSVSAQTAVTITAGTHGQGTLAHAFCFDNASPANAVTCGYTRNGSGNLVFAFNPAFTGTIQVEP